MLLHLTLVLPGAMQGDVDLKCKHQRICWVETRHGALYHLGISSYASVIPTEYYCVSFFINISTVSTHTYSSFLPATILDSYIRVLHSHCGQDAMIAQIGILTTSVAQFVVVSAFSTTNDAGGDCDGWNSDAML